MCGYCNTAWEIICGNMTSGTLLLDWIDMCSTGGCDPDLWEYVDEKTGGLDLAVLPPEFVPGLPRTDVHRAHRAGPYRKEKPQPKVKKVPVIEEEIEWLEV
jgi:hypothetical protein